MLFLYVAVVAIVFVKVLGADVTGAKELKLMSKKTARKNRLAAHRAQATRLITKSGIKSIANDVLGSQVGMSRHDVGADCAEPMA